MTDWTDLSVRQTDVLKCAAVGMSVKQTAKRLNITPNTVKSTRQNILTKWRAWNITHAVHLGHRRGVL